MLHLLVRALTLLFPVSEIALLLFRRSKGLGGASRDQGSVAMLWGTMGAGLAAAILVAPYHLAPLRIPQTALDALIAAVMAGGMVLRWTAIRTLGRFFTVDVAIHPEQKVVCTGPYAWVRHPSYSGLLLLWLGVGLTFGNGLSLLALMLPVTAALLKRIRTEETALRQGLGEPYEAYCRTTKQLVPGLF
jgi:protein-S-isoprenylcysteine O-methyltransferase